MVQAFEEITCVQAYTQSCPEAAIRTHDSISRPLKFTYVMCLFPDNHPIRGVCSVMLLLGQRFGVLLMVVISSFEDAINNIV